jgi:two-component system invasion response regulator UvrY
MTKPAPAPSGLKVLVIGADPVLRRGIAQYLRLTIPTVTIAEALSDSEGLEMVRASAWDVIVLDMSSTSELALLGQFKVAKPDVPILVLHVDPAPANATAAIAAGAAGYLCKGSPAPDWRTAVETVARGAYIQALPAFSSARCGIGVTIVTKLEWF